MVGRLFLLVSLPLCAACGGLVVFEGEGEGGTGGGSASSTSVQTTGTTAAGDPACAGLGCGDGCVACVGSDCSSGFCDKSGACVPGPPPCDVETSCYQAGPAQPCAAADEVGPLLCAVCAGGAGCSFVGSVLDGPWLAPDGCCYAVVGECVPHR